MEPLEQEKWSKAVVLRLFLIVFLSGLAYLNSLDGSFHFDDHSTIVNNGAIRDLTDLRRIAASQPARPVLMLTFALNYYFGGMEVFGYHLVNLLLHVAVCLLIYRLASLIFLEGQAESPVSVGSSLASSLPLLAALLFALHPVHTEAVSYISSRSSVLCAFFYLSSFLLFDRTSRPVPGAPRLQAHLLLAGSLMAFALALGSKEEAATLPLVLLLYLCLILFPGLPLRRILRQHGAPLLPFLATGLLYLSWRVFSQGALEGMSAPVRSYNTVSPGLYALTELKVIVFYYLRRLLVPIGLNIDPDIPFYASIWEPSTLLAAAVILALLAVSWKLFGKERPLAFAILWFLITLLPSSSFVPLTDAAAEHRLYLPGVGFALFSAPILTRLACRAGERLSPSGTRWAAAALCVGLLLAYGLGTVERNATYREELTLWKDAAGKSPFKARPHNNLAVAYLGQGRIDDAIREVKQVLRLEPDYVPGFVNLGLAYSQKGLFDQAILEYQKALRIDPRYVPAHNNLGEIYLYNLGRLDEALAYFKEALRLSPKSVKVLNNLGMAYGRKGRLDEALAVLDRTLKLAPEHVEARINLGAAYAEKGLYDKAVVEFQRALKIDPDNFRAEHNLMRAVHDKHRQDGSAGHPGQASGKGTRH